MTNNTNFDPIMLTDDMTKQLQDMSPAIDYLRLEIERAKRAGLPVTDLDTKFKEMVSMREGLLTEYTK